MALVIVAGALFLVGCAHATNDSTSTGAAGSASTAQAGGAVPADAAIETMLIAPPPDAGPGTATVAAGGATPKAPADVEAAAPGTASVPADSALDPALFACRADADCTAVRKNGCCNHGELEAVAASQVAAYKASFTCRTHVMCPQFLRRDLRVAACDRAASRCQMVTP